MRFTQPDTIVPGAGNPQAWNRYAYTLNNPVNLIDPSGHAPICDEEGNCYDPARGYYRGIRSGPAPKIIIAIAPTRIASDAYLLDLPSRTPTPTPSLVSDTPTVCLTPAPEGSPSCYVLADTPDLSSDLESGIAGVISTTVDFGEEMNWWHFPTIVGFGIDAYSQYTLDKGEGYSSWQIVAGAGVVGIEGQIITSFSAVGTGISGVAGIGTGFFDIAIMLGTYGLSNAILSKWADRFNDKYIFPIIGIPSP